MSLPYPLAWVPKARFGSSYREAVLTNPDASVGVRFSIVYQPTCYRRGQYKLLIEIMDGPYQFAWGRFDNQDQPLRYYHSDSHALAEAQMIADVLQIDLKPERVAKS